MKHFNFIVLISVLVFSVFASDNPMLSGNESPLADCDFASVQAEYKNSKAVFTGKVIEVIETEDTKIYEFRVEKYWKGVKGRKIKITAGKNMRYEPNYQTGKNYLIYAFAGEKGALRVGKCTRGFAVDFAKEDLKILGKGKKMR